MLCILPLSVKTPLQAISLVLSLSFTLCSGASLHGERRLELAHHLALFPGDTVAAVDSLLTEMSIASHPKLTAVKINLGSISLKDAAAYQRLQQRLATEIPTEYERPILQILFLGSGKSPASPKNTIGIVGGMGPLSDARIMRALSKKTKKHPTKLNFQLLSLPPPRSVGDKLTGSYAYVKRLWHFGRKGYRSYLLASNTAHVNFPSFQRMVGPTRAHNLVAAITTRIAKKQAHASKPILVLGSTQAWKAKLYPELFDKHGLKAMPLPKKKEQKMVQAFIDCTKAGKECADERLKVVALIQHHAPIDHAILLGCTELSLGLSDMISVDQKGVATFLEREVYDSEALMVDEILTLKPLQSV